ncbi:MAG: type II toxin-antitoxin system Phd/YefM family antitoxin [Bryobacteraceae bacterium]
MPQFNVHEAKSNLSRLLDRSLEGEEVVISRHGIPLVRLMPVRTKRGDRKLGYGRGGPIFSIPQRLFGQWSRRRIFRPKRAPFVRENPMNPR